MLFVGTLAAGLVICGANSNQRQQQLRPGASDWRVLLSDWSIWMRALLCQPNCSTLQQEVLTSNF